MKIVKRVTLLFFLFAVSWDAYGVLIEPSIGYKLIHHGETAPKYNYQAANMGLRLGMQIFGLGVGGDFNCSPASISHLKEGKVKQSDKHTHGSMGLFASYQFPAMVVPLGVRLHYILKAKFKEDASDPQELEGDGFGAGVSVATSIPFLSVNLDYKQITYDKSISGAAGDWETHEVLASISFPITFP